MNLIFFQELKKYGVTTIVRVCEATYDTAPLEKEGIQVLVSSLLEQFEILLACEIYCGPCYSAYIKPEH